VNRDKLREGVIRPALVAAGLPDTIRTYDLRHSHASLLFDAGANVLPWLSGWDTATRP
jgi:site-specific recombinase XerD